MTQACVRALALAALAAAIGPRHIGASDADRFLLCATAAFGKPVFVDPALGKGSELAGLACPKDAASLRQALDARRVVAKQGPDWVYLVPARFFEPPAIGTLVAPVIQWNEIRFQFETKSARAEAAHRIATAAELGEIRRALFGAARQAPVQSIRAPDGAGSVASIEYTMTAAIVVLKDHSSEDVVVTMGVEDELQRIAFGHFTNRRFVCAWDSPVINGRHLQVRYSDLDGDGWQEIIVSSQEGAILPWQSFIAFSRTGDELTRQSACDAGALAGYPQGAVVCPLMGERFEIRATAPGRPKIIVSRGSIDDDEGKLEHTFRLVGFHYVEQVPR